MAGAWQGAGIHCGETHDAAAETALALQAHGWPTLCLRKLAMLSGSMNGPCAFAIRLLPASLSVALAAKVKCPLKEAAAWAFR